MRPKKPFPPQRSAAPVRVFIVLFVVFVTLIASYNLSPSSGSASGLPVYGHAEVDRRELYGGGGMDSSESVAVVEENSVDASLTVDSGRPARKPPAPVAGATAADPPPGRPAANANPAKKGKYHIVMTTSDGIYVEWQSRVSYFYYKKLKEQYPDSDMGGFTRLLHSGKPDEWMDEIPTVVVDPLPDDLQAIAAGYVVLNRPYGLKQWVEKHMDSIEEDYIMMTEPDHLFLTPPPNWATPTTAAAFPFFYIEPAAQQNVDLVQRYNAKSRPLSDFYPVGNSPVIIHKKQAGPTIKLWTDLSIKIKQDEEADRQWGWVQEMFAWSIASAQQDPPVKYELHPELMLQPPWDATVRNAENGLPSYIIHYTYGNDFAPNGTFTPGKVGAWHWDKRDFSDKYPPMNFPMPPEGSNNEVVTRLVTMVNKAAEVLPGWKERAFKSVAEVPILSEK